MPKLSIQIVIWNNVTDLPELFESLQNQTFKDFSVRVVDNGSNDGAEKWLREKYPQVMIIRNTRNLGFAAAHNQIFKFALSKWFGDDLSRCYCLVITPDVILRPDCLEKIIAAAESDLTVGSLAPKILRSFQDNQVDEVLREQVCSDVIESTGLKVSRFIYFSGRGSGELDRGQFDEKLDVFGAGRVFALYRASALEDVVLKNGDYFDSKFFNYAEDFDLAWRLRWRGWGSIFVPTAVVHHARGAYNARKGFFGRLFFRRPESKVRRLFLRRNRWWVIVKNLCCWDVLWRLPIFFVREFFGFIFTLFFEPKILKIYWQFFHDLPAELKIRHEVLSGRKVPNSELRKWFGKK